MSSIQEIKALVNAAEQEVHIAKDALKATEKGIEEANEQHRIAKATHDALVIKLANVKAQFREQIMEDGLRESNRWNEMYKKLLEWKENNNGDVLVPVGKDSDEDTKKLSRWVINQRSSYKYFNNGDTKHIKDHRIDALNKIGFVWSVADHTFQGNVQELKQYHANHDNFDVPMKTNKKLAAFVSRIRTAYAAKIEGLPQHDLTNEKVDQLNAIGFKWNLKKSRKRTSSSKPTASMDYDTMYNLLLEFKQQYGHAKVNKLIKEWQKGIGEPAKKEFRRLSVFLTHVRKGRCGNPVLFISCVTRHKAQVLTQHDHFPQMMLIEEFILYQQGQPSTLDAEKIKNLSALGLEWKQPPNVPRKNTGGETSRKKKPKIEPPSQEDFAGFDVGEPGLPPLAVPSPAVLLDTATLPSPGGERVMI